MWKFLLAGLLIRVCHSLTLKVALCQIHSGNDKTRNIENAKTMIDQAASTGASVIVLPEIWNSPYATDQFPVHAEALPPIGWSAGKSGNSGYGPSAVMLSEQALHHNVVIVGGSVPEISGGSIFNTALVLGPTGEVLATHRKVHLFDINIPGKMTFMESDTLTPGDKVTVFRLPEPLDDVVMGLGICYDLRFPEYAAALRAKGANLLVYPGAFNTHTGPLHWELLGRARAVDQQSFVVLASPARVPGASYQAWGHSTVIDPWGEILATTDESEEIVVADLDFSKVSAMREGIPTWGQRRNDQFYSSSSTPPQGLGGEDGQCV